MLFLELALIRWIGANDVYVVAGPLGELLIPAIADVVQSIDTARGLVVVRPLPGLLSGDD